MKIKTIAVFGSGKVTQESLAYQQAVKLGRLLAQKGFVVCNGGYRGIMEASARGVKEAGGKTIGIAAGEFVHTKVNAWITETKQVKTWGERLFKLVETADAYIVCDGGTGTLTELFVVWEMINKGMIKKPVVVLGKFLHSLTEFLKKDPLIHFPNCLKLAYTPEEAVEQLTTMNDKDAGFRM